MEVDRSKGKWYILQVMSGHEFKVREKIEKQIGLADASIPIYEVVCLIEKVTEIKNGKKYCVNKKIHPGYLYLRMDLYHENDMLNEEAWYFVKQIQGVISFPGSNDRPQPLSTAEGEDLIRLIDAADNVKKVHVPDFIRAGNVVRIIDGAFTSFEGKIEEIDENRGKLKLMVSIFGRDTPVELEFGQVGQVEN